MKSDIWFFVAVIGYVIESVVISLGYVSDPYDYHTMTFIGVLIAPFVFLPLRDYLDI